MQEKLYLSEAGRGQRKHKNPTRSGWEKEGQHITMILRGVVWGGLLFVVVI